LTGSRNVQEGLHRSQEVARILLEQGAVSINAEHPFVYASGATGPIYCDLRLLMAVPPQRGRIVDLLVACIQETCPSGYLDVVAGVATAGIPWAAWVATRLNKPMAYVRDAPKGHGKGQQVEGGVAAGRSSVVLEDLTNQGGSALTAVAGLREIGVKADYCYSIFTYEFPQASAAFKAAGVKLSSLCGLSTLLEVATSSGQIDSKAERDVREWQRKGSVIPKAASAGA